MFLDLGISVNVTQVYQFGRIWAGWYYNKKNDGTEWQKYETVIAKNNGVIGSSIEYTDPSYQWMSGIRDIDVPSSYLNWIRSGSYVEMGNSAYNDYNMSSTQYGSTGQSQPWDPNENWEKIANRSWTTPMFATNTKHTSHVDPGPVAPGGRVDSLFKFTTSIDVVFTADKSKWTRCPVIEMCLDPTLSENGVARFNLRKHASVDKDGNPYMIKDENNKDIPFNLWSQAGDAQYVSNNPEDPNFIGAQGMGWFPGYVIDVENGVRLNVAFGEDSYLEDLGGRDMIFNPAKVQKATAEDPTGLLQEYDPAIFRGADNDPVFGGKHFVYIWRMDSLTNLPSTFPWKQLKNYGYDGGQLLFNSYNAIQNLSSSAALTVNRIFYKLVMWIGMPMGIEGMEWLPEGNECRVRIRLAKPYAPGYGFPLQEENPDLMINNLNPKYTFKIEGWDPVMNDEKKSDEDLNLVTVVPNPYYAYNAYEGNALTNKVKIINLPDKCIVSIYTLSGTKVRQFRKDNETTSIEWDLTNFANTPVASGFYLIHVKDLTSGGERTIKFFGAMRQVDLNTF